MVANLDRPIHLRPPAPEPGRLARRSHYSVPMKAGDVACHKNLLSAGGRGATPEDHMTLRPLYFLPVVVAGAVLIGCSDNDDHDWNHHRDEGRVVYDQRGGDEYHHHDYDRDHGSDHDRDYDHHDDHDHD